MAFYKEDRAFADNFIDESRIFVALSFVEVSSDKQDKSNGIDLFIPHCVGGIGIAHRIRKWFILNERQKKIITLRAKSPDGKYDKELEKSVNEDINFADYYFYGFQNAENEYHLKYWSMYNVNVIVQHMLEYKFLSGVWPGEYKQNLKTDLTHYQEINLTPIFNRARYSWGWYDPTLSFPYVCYKNKNKPNIIIPPTRADMFEKFNKFEEANKSNIISDISDKISVTDDFYEFNNPVLNYDPCAR